VGAGKNRVEGRKIRNLGENRSIYARVFDLDANKHLDSPVEDLGLFGKEQKVWLSAETDAAVPNDPKTSTCAGTAFELMRSVYIKDG
jgi:hypothetical protein